MVKRKHYPADFRQKAADLAMAADAQTVDIAKALGVCPSTLSNWVSRRKKQLHTIAKVQEVNEQKNEEGSERQMPFTSDITPEKTVQAKLSILESQVEKLLHERQMLREAFRTLFDDELYQR